MKSLIGSALRFRVIVVASAVLTVLLGYRVLPNTPLDVFPEFAPPLVEIQTEAPGLSAVEVESLVSVPLENALNGTSWLETIRSKSVEGLSSVVLLFDEDVDVMRARQLVQERLSRAATLLPDAASAPVMLSPLSSTSRVLKIGLWSDEFDQTALSEMAKWTIRPRLMAIPGVANVAIWGQRDRQIQVLVEPDRLHAAGVRLSDVLQAAAASADSQGGGFLDTPNQRLAVSHARASADVESIGAMPLAIDASSPLRIMDVADVTEGNPAAIGDAIINDVPGILLIVEKEPWGNTLTVTRELEAVLDLLRPGLTGVHVDSTIFRPATFIEMSLANLGTALLIGCFFVVAVLVLFLYEWRTAAISLVAIPLSLITAVLVLHYQGASIDTMVLAGLIIALGEVVDDAIIDVENITRRLRLNDGVAQPRSAFAVVLDASLEVRSAVVYASVIIVLAFAPVFFLDGLAGTFFRPLAYAYVIAIVASLVVALTVTPALSLILLPGRVVGRGDSPLVHWLKGHYRRLLPRFLAPRVPVPQLIGASVICVSLLVPFLGEEFLPHFREYDFLMHWVEKPGTSLEAMRRITIRASKELRAIPGVRNFGSHIGRAEVADEVVGANFTELWISLDPDIDYDATVARVQEVVDGYPGLYRDLLTYLRERVKEVLTGTSASIVVRIYGPDLDVLLDRAHAVKGAIADVPGVVDLKVQPQTVVPHVEVRYRPAEGLAHGLSASAVRRDVTTLLKGRKVGQLYEDQKAVDLVVWGAPWVRNDVSALRGLMLDAPGGARVPLRAVADVEMVSTPGSVTRENASRRIDVTCNVRGDDLGAVARAIEAQVGELDFAPGYHPEVLGEFAERQAAQGKLLGLSALSLLGVFLLLHADFGSSRMALLVLLSLPFALVGAVGAVAISGAVLTLGSLVGFVTVAGIAARNGLMLISHYRHLECEENMPFGRELVLRGAEERLAPILMTAVTTAFALLPVALGGDLPGHEIEHPMAIVILGGLTSSTLLSLFGLPALYLRWGNAGERLMDDE